MSEAILECRDVSVGFPSSNGFMLLFSSLSFSLARQERLLIVGRSGSGKSSLLRLLNRFDEPHSGTILFEGKPLADHDVLDVRRRICLLPQNSVMFEGSVRDNLLLQSQRLPPIREERAREVLCSVGLSESKFNEPADRLSGGERQRVAICRALLRDPEILLLDEPTSALDAKTSGELVDLLSSLQERSQLSLVVVTHQAELARRLGGTLIAIDNQRAEVGLPPEAAQALLA